MKHSFITDIQPVIHFCSPVWNTGFISAWHQIFWKVQKRWTKKVEGLSDLFYIYRLRNLSFFSIWGLLLRSDLIFVWKITHNLIHTLWDIFVYSTDSRKTGNHSIWWYNIPQQRIVGINFLIGKLLSGITCQIHLSFFEHI